MNDFDELYDTVAYYQQPTGLSDYGDIQYGSITQFECAYLMRDDVVRSTDNEEIITSSVVATSINLGRDCRVWIGDAAQTADNMIVVRGGSGQTFDGTTHYEWKCS